VDKKKMIQRIKGLLKRRGFELFTQPFELNIIGLRNKNPKIADEIHVFYKINAKNWNYHIYEAITDPVVLLEGKRDSLLLKERQYKDCYSIGLHNGKVKVLIQSNPVTVIKNHNRDSFLQEGKSVSGLFNIDIIPASAIEKTDEGNQVFLSNENFKEFMALCEKHKELYGNKFSYSLIDFRNGKKSIIKKGFFIAASLLTSLLFGYLFRENKKKKRNK
jgi:hypothetical protein